LVENISQAQCCGALTALSTNNIGLEAMLKEPGLTSTICNIMLIYHQRFKVGGGEKSVANCNFRKMVPPLQKQRQTPRHKDFEWWSSMMVANLADGQQDTTRTFVAKGIGHVCREVELLSFFFFFPSSPKGAARLS